MVMFIEKKRKGVSSRLFTANGDANGRVTVADARDFFVKQKVHIKSNALPEPKQFEIKRFVSNNSFKIGPIGDSINAFADISAYLVTDNASISASEQDRPGIKPDEIRRATYMEEPISAIRSFAVDEYGNSYNKDNPLPVSAELDSVQLFDRPYDSGTEQNPTPTRQIFTTYVGGLSGTPLQRVTLNFVDATRENLVDWQREYWNGSSWVIG